MEDYNRLQLQIELEREEGRFSRPHVTAHKIIVIGVGWNLDQNGLPEEIIDYLLDYQITRAENGLDHIYPNWRNHDPVRQRVLLHMIFVLSLERMQAHEGLFRAMDQGNYFRASQIMQRAEWFKEISQRVKGRGQRLADMMRYGPGFEDAVWNHRNLRN